MASPDYSKFPKGLGADVVRVFPDGKPTDHQLDVEFGQRYWLEQTAKNFDSRIIEVGATADDAAAAVSIEQTARIAGDTALASQITTVEAKTDAGTANGNVRFTAVSAPTGTDVRYAIQIQTSTPGVFAEAGVYLDLIGANSTFTVRADNFQFQDPDVLGGVPTPVMTYNSGVGALVFGVPVIINTGELAAGAVSGGSFNSGVLANSSSIGVTRTITAGSRVVVSINVQKEDGTGATVAATLSAIVRQYNLKIDGTTVDSMYSYDRVIAATGGSYTGMPESCHRSFVFDGTIAAGSHTFTLENPAVFSYNMRADILVQEFKR